MLFGNKNTHKGLKIIIVGCGKVGTNLLIRLRDENHDITIIDKNPNVINELAGMYDVLGIVGNGATHNVLEDAGINDADLIIAVTGSDELNLLCCTIAKQNGNCATIARVRQPEYLEEMGYIREKLGLTMIINPEHQAALEASRILYLPTALEINTFAHGQAELIKIKVPENNMLDGSSLIELAKKVNLDVLICAVERSDQVFIPSGQFVLRAGDVISFVGQRRVVKKFLMNIGINTESVKDCLIVGGGKAAYYLASQLLAMNIAVKIIESNEDRCNELTSLVPEAVIINADGTSEDVLKEEGIEYCSSFVPLTGIDEENVMLTLYAKSVSGAKCITKINRTNFKGVLSTLDLGSVIYPKSITAEAIIAYVRARQNSADRSNIESLYHMYDGRVEAIEFLIDEHSAATDTPFSQLKLKPETLVCCIFRNGSIIIPSGSDSIQVGDTVTLVTTHKGWGDITDMLA